MMDRPMLFPMFIIFSNVYHSTQMLIITPQGLFYSLINHYYNFLKCITIPHSTEKYFVLHAMLD